MPKKRFTFGKKKRYCKLRGRHAVSNTTIVESSMPATVVEESVPVEAEDHQVLNTSVAERKVASSSINLTNPADSDLQYSIVSSMFLSSLASLASCPECSNNKLSIQTTKKIGLGEHIVLFCAHCEKRVWSNWTSPPVQNKKGILDINIRSVLVLKECGITHSKFFNFCGLMSFPKYLHRNTFARLGKMVRAAVINASEDCMKNAAAVVCERAKVQPDERASSSNCPVITVSFDGTWHKRGHSSHTGVGTVIEFHTGLILDTQVLSNLCKGCLSSPKPDSQQYMQWQASHKSKCQKIFDGSANAMEPQSAALIFSRSVLSRGLVYGTILSDGDSKSHAAAIKHSGYDINIIKEDCINHIAKRMFNALETLKSANKKELNYKLTQPDIEKITNLYASNLREHAPDVNRMKMAVMASFFHMLSTDREPNHRLCPDGETSWCHFKRAIACNRPPRKHTPTFTSDVGKLIFPIVKRLTEPDLLIRCAKMGTQNANESFHSTIWRRCPKIEHASYETVETATHLAVLNFNCGPAGIRAAFGCLNLKWTVLNNDFAKRQQELKIESATKKSKGLSKWKRKNLKKRQVEAERRKKSMEGTTYKPGQFNV